MKKMLGEKSSLISENEIFILTYSCANLKQDFEGYLMGDLDEKPNKKKKMIQPVVICPTVSQFVL